MQRTREDTLLYGPCDVLFNARDIPIPPGCMRPELGAPKLVDEANVAMVRAYVVLAREYETLLECARLSVDSEEHTRTRTRHTKQE